MRQKQTFSSVNEQWASPPSLNRPYVQVSNLGRIRTLDRDVQMSGLRHGIQHRKGRVLKVSKDSRGRPIISGAVLSKHLIGRTFLVHRLVAECFATRKKGLPYVFLKSPPPLNIRSSNLEWGGMRDKVLRQRGRDVKYLLSVRDRRNEVIGTFRGCGEVARRMGLTKQAVYYALLRGTPTRKGYFVSVAEKES